MDIHVSSQSFSFSENVRCAVSDLSISALSERVLTSKSKLPWWFANNYKMDDDLDLLQAARLAIPTPRLKTPLRVSELSGRRRVVFEIDGSKEQLELLEDDEEDEINEDDETLAQTDPRLYAEKLKTKSLIHACGNHPEVNFATFYDENKMQEMKAVDERGLVKKTIIREGRGAVVPDNCNVFVDFVISGDGLNDPIDSTVLRGHPVRIDFRDVDIIPGLYLAIKSMSIGEVARVWIHHEYAYGEIGCAPRIPPSTHLFCFVEVLDVIEENRLNLLPYMSSKERQLLSFQEIYEAANALNGVANLDYKNLAYWPAIKSYRKAVNMLEDYSTISQEDSDKRQELLYKLYMNLSQCYLKVKKPQQVCISCKLAIRCVEAPKTVDAKLYFRFAEGKLMLHSFDDAKNLNKEALRRDPNNGEILKQTKRIEQGKQEDIRMTNMSYNKMKGFLNKKSQPTPTAAAKDAEQALQETDEKTDVEIIPEKKPDEVLSFDWDEAFSESSFEAATQTQQGPKTSQIEEKLVIGHGHHGPSYEAQKNATIYDLLEADLHKKK